MSYFKNIVFVLLVLEEEGDLPGGLRVHHVHLHRSQHGISTGNQQSINKLSNATNWYGAEVHYANLQVRSTVSKQTKELHKSTTLSQR